MIRVAINGFGRIGKNFLRAYLFDERAQQQFKIVVINCGPGDITHAAYLFEYDTLLGTYPGLVAYENEQLLVDDVKINLIAQPDVQNINWKTWDVDWVVDCSGKFTHADQARLHIKAGAKKVLISAPAHGEDITVVPGVNMNMFNPQHHTIVSLGSCTTNAFIPLIKVVHEAFGIEHGMMTTTHAYTNSQVLLDVEKHDLRRSRAAALNIIPTSTGASAMVDKFFPDLAKRITSVAVRVPVAKVSLIDFTFLVKKPISVELLHLAFKTALNNDLAGILILTDEPLVSSDFAGDSHSVIVDTLLTSVQGHMGKLFGWYDNEWAYSVRLKDFLVHAAQLRS